MITTSPPKPCPKGQYRAVNGMCLHDRTGVTLDQLMTAVMQAATHQCDGVKDELQDCQTRIRSIIDLFTPKKARKAK